MMSLLQANHGIPSSIAFDATQFLIALTEDQPVCKTIS